MPLISAVRTRNTTAALEPQQRTRAETPTLTCPDPPPPAQTVGALTDALFALDASAMDSNGLIASPTPAISCTPASFADIPAAMLRGVDGADATIPITCSGADAPECTFDVTVTGAVLSASPWRGSFGDILWRTCLQEAPLAFRARCL